MRCGYRTILMLGALVLGAPAALAQTGLPADTELRRQRFLTNILDPNGALSRTVARDRQGCAGGAAPLNDRASRAGDWKSVGAGKRVQVRVALGGGRILKKKNKKKP